jgi:D-alanyl-D-alanine carboxypeptidase
MSHKGSDKQLEDFRYDARLFRQAYKAGLKAKKNEEINKRKRQWKILGAVVLSIIFGISIISLLRSGIFQRPTYIKAEGNDTKQVDITEGFLPTSPPKVVNQEDVVNAQSALLADLNTGQIIYTKNANEKVSVASLSKLITALVVLREFDLKEEIEVKKDWYREEDMEWSLGLDKGDTVTVEILLTAMLVSSYNDAVYVLADHMEGGIESFVKEMNEYAQVLGLQDTQFNNPSGLDSQGGNISTVTDLYRLASIIYHHDFIMNTLSKGYADLSWDIGEERIYTTNTLLGKLNNIAGKTGYTEVSGQCFLGITDDAKVSIVLNSEDRFEDTESLLKF